LESSLIIDVIECAPDKEPAKTLWELFEAAENKQCELITSVATIAEVFYAKHERDKKKLDPEISAQIEKLWHPDSSPLRLIEVHELIAREAGAMLRDHVVKGFCKTGGLDGIHLVTAKREKADEFFCSERAMTKWGEVLGFKVCKPHLPPAAQVESKELQAAPLFEKKAPTGDAPHATPRQD
jgi:hypothetical protein